MQEQMYFPEGGVGSFLTSNMDEMPDNVLAFGQPRGINSMGDVANRMAQMGRNGDTELAHVNRDEIIIDRNMARDPRIRNAVAEVFRDNDLDLARYTVGNAANSINPYTGQREFFLKKLVFFLKKPVFFEENLSSYEQACLLSKELVFNSNAGVGLGGVWGV